MESLFEMLTARLAECRDGVRFLGGRLVDVQYAPAVGAHVLWKIKAHDPDTGRTGRQLIYVRALGAHETIPSDPVDLIAKYRDLRACKGMARRMPLRTPWVVNHDARVLVHAFPLDPAMPSLMNVAHPEAMRIALQHLWQARGARVRRVNVDTLSYTPAARAALQYEILAEDSRTRLPELRRLVGKIDVRRPPSRLFAGHWAVWRQSSGRVSMAPPVGYIAVSRLSLQEFVSGTRLSDIAGTGELAGRVRKAAQSIASVHALNAPVIKHRGVEKEMSNVQRWGAVLSQVRPAQAGRIETLSGRLRRELADRMRITATVHADFHLANILSDRHGVTLIDWDQAGHGDAMLDIGRLLASLRVASLRLNGKLDGLSAVGEGFLETYLDRTGEDVYRARLFEAASLVTAAATPFRLQREGWEDYADMMIDEVERVLDLSVTGARVAGTPADFKREIAFKDRAGWAMDKVYAQALLVLLVHDAYGSDIEVTETRPRNKGVSATKIRVAWKLNGYKGQQRWKLAVEGIGFPDTSGRNILHRLEHAHSAAAVDSACLQLPRPIGRIAPLSLVVFEPPRGERFTSALGTERETASVSRLAEALARFNALDIELTKARETARIVRSVARRVRIFEQSGNSAAPAARELLSAITELLDLDGGRSAPTIFPFGLRAIRATDTGFATSTVHDVVMANPLLNAASLLAELALNALGRGARSPIAEVFRNSYQNASGESASDLALWEALMLLRLACVTGLQGAQPDLPVSMLEIAKGRLEEAVADSARSMVASATVSHGLLQGNDL
jgi:hypothetical protein